MESLVLFFPEFSVVDSSIGFGIFFFGPEIIFSRGVRGTSLTHILEVLVP